MNYLISVLENLTSDTSKHNLAKTPVSENEVGSSGMFGVVAQQLLDERGKHHMQRMSKWSINKNHVNYY